jgi:hypothetical protein
MATTLEPTWRIAVQKLNRGRIGIDVTHLSVGLMKLRLKDSFGMLPMQKPAR